MKILLCSIVRNMGNRFETWLSQINKSIELLGDYEVSISVFENDSTDDTKEKLSKGVFSGKFKNIFISKNDLGHPYFSSISNETRVKNLAFYRNSCLRVTEDYDYFIFIESDVEYSPSTIFNLIKITKENDADIASGVSLNRKSLELYDSWATRVEKEDVEFLRKKYPIDGSIYKLHSTFNCVCLYKNKGIKNPFGYINKNGAWDCDTYVICENYREVGANKIIMDTNLKIYH